MCNEKSWCVLWSGVSYGLRNAVFLEGFETVFLLEVFSDMFSCTDLLFSLLQTKHFDVLYCEMKMRGTQAHFCCDGDHSFPSICVCCVSQKNPAE